MDINAITKAYAAFLRSGSTYGEALRSAAAQLKGRPCPELMLALAKVHAAHFSCNYTWNASGRAVFHTGAESTRDTRHDAAARSWQRNVLVHFTTGEPKKAKSVDPVAKMIKALEGLTAAQRRKVLAHFA